MTNRPLRAILLCLLSLSASYTLGQSTSDQMSWETVEADGKPTARHEAALVGFEDKLYLIGGRRINPVDVFDPKTNTWAAKSKTPLELHHFQGVVVEDRIYLMGAMTGKYPRETPLEKVVVYHPKTDTFEFVHSIPESRRRGGAGAVYHNGKIYLVGGITNGHVDGYQPWLDEYDPETGQWNVLPDAPNARDHFQAAVIDIACTPLQEDTHRRKRMTPLAKPSTRWMCSTLKAEPGSLIHNGLHFQHRGLAT